MAWKSSLFSSGRMDQKAQLFLPESRCAHDRLTNLLILSYPLLVGSWQFRETAKHFAPLADPAKVRDAVFAYIQFPTNETAIRRFDLRESVSNISWERQRDATAEMMFLVCCSIYENFTSDIQDHVFRNQNITPSSRQRPIEKGLQFPSTDYDFTTTPPTKKNSSYSENAKKAFSHFSISSFMKRQICSTFPIKNHRNIFDDFELKMHSYLLFKKLRNTISHGTFDRSIPHQYEVVDLCVTPTSLGSKAKVSISKDSSGSYYVSLYNVIGFISLILNIIRDIDFIYLISNFGEADLIDRIKETNDGKNLGPKNMTQDLSRLRKCITHLGVKGFHVDSAARTHFINQGAWKA